MDQNIKIVHQKEPANVEMEFLVSNVTNVLKTNTICPSGVLVSKIYNIHLPSLTEFRQASVKLTISPSNTFNLKWENQILASDLNCCKINFIFLCN